MWYTVKKSKRMIKKKKKIQDSIYLLVMQRQVNRIREEA